AHRQKTALITGASSGIGYELTMLFARDGYDLVLIARSQARLAQVADDVQHRHGVAVRVLAHDLAQPTAAAQIVAQLQEVDLTISEGPACARCPNNRAQPGSACSIRSISARQIGSS